VEKRHYPDISLLVKRRKRRRVIGIAGIVILLVVVIALGVTTYHLPANSKINVDLTTFTVTIIPNGSIINVQASSNAVYQINLEYDSAIHAGFNATYGITFYIFTAAEYSSFNSGELFGYLFSSSNTTHGSISASLIVGKYYLVFSNAGSSYESTVIITYPLTETYTL
jgi:hypothetical protein